MFQNYDVGTLMFSWSWLEYVVLGDDCELMQALYTLSPVTF